MREWLSQDLGLNAAEGTGPRVIVAALCDAWECAVKRATTQAKADAERKVQGEVEELQKGAS